MFRYAKNRFLTKNKCSIIMLEHIIYLFIYEEEICQTTIN